MEITVRCPFKVHQIGCIQEKPLILTTQVKPVLNFTNKREREILAERRGGLSERERERERSWLRRKPAIIVAGGGLLPLQRRDDTGMVVVLSEWNSFLMYFSFLFLSRC